MRAAFPLLAFALAACAQDKAPDRRAGWGEPMMPETYTPDQRAYYAAEDAFITKYIEDARARGEEEQAGAAIEIHAAVQAERCQFDRRLCD